jgi:hypothetical protein
MHLDHVSYCLFIYFTSFRQDRKAYHKMDFSSIIYRNYCCRATENSEVVIIMQKKQEIKRSSGDSRKLLISDFKMLPPAHHPE